MESVKKYIFALLALVSFVELPITAQDNQFKKLVESSPMVAALFYKDDAGALGNELTQASRTPRYRYADIQFVNVDVSQPGVDQVLQQENIVPSDLPLVALFRDGKIITDDNNNVIGLQEGDADDIREFIDDYFADAIEGILQYREQTDTSYPTQIIYDNTATVYDTYYPVTYYPGLIWTYPRWWRGYFNGHYYRPFRPGVRHGRPWADDRGRGIVRPGRGSDREFGRGQDRFRKGIERPLRPLGVSPANLERARTQRGTLGTGFENRGRDFGGGGRGRGMSVGRSGGGRGFGGGRGGGGRGRR